MGCIIWIIFSVSLAFAVIVFVSMLLLRKRFRPSGTNIDPLTDKRACVDKLFLDYILKAIAVLFLVVFVVRLCFYDSFTLVINGGRAGKLPVSDIGHSLVRWGLNIGVIAFPMAVFFKSRLFKNICVFVSLPFAIAATATFDRFIWYYTQTGGSGVDVSLPLRKFFLAFELCLALILPLLLVACDRHYLKVFDKKEVLRFCAALPFVIILACPITVPQSLFGYIKFTYSSLSMGNIFWIVLVIAEICALYLLFRFRPLRERYMVCVLLALAAFVGSVQSFSMGFSLVELPLQIDKLCIYLLLPALIIKKQKFFNFVFIAAIASGAVTLLTAATRAGSATSFWGFHFFTEHTALLVIPVLCSLLRIFPRVSTDKAIKHFTVGFAAYFAFIWILGTVLNGLTGVTGLGRVNYLYIFDVTVFSGMLSLPSFMTVSITMGKFVLYPVFQLLAFGAFWLIGFMVYFMVQKLYAFVDDHFQLRLARLDAQERLLNKKSKAKREYAD